MREYFDGTYLMRDQSFSTNVLVLSVLLVDVAGVKGGVAIRDLIT